MLWIKEKIKINKRWLKLFDVSPTERWGLYPFPLTVSDSIYQQRSLGVTLCDFCPVSWDPPSRPQAGRRFRQ